MTKKNYKGVVLTPLPDRELEIVGAITAEKMGLMREKALKKLKESVELPGFRKGNAPDSIVAQKIGERTLLEEAAEIALNEEYPNILEEHNIDAIGRPEITITKIGLGSDMEFKIKTSLMPEVKLADYKKIAKKVLSEKTESIKVTEKDVEDVIQNIRENIAHEKVHQESLLERSESNKSSEANASRAHNHRKIEDSDLPEVNDEFAKMLGNFESLEEMKSKIRENLAKEKELKAKDKKRTEILEKVIEESTIELPKIVVEGEMEKMLAQFKDDIAKSGISYEDYLKHIKKTEKDLRDEWKDASIKRAKSQVILNTISKEESIAPKEEEIKREMENILANYKEADRFRVRMYVETFLTNELVFQFLEKQ
ncbi:MAG: trigger factor [Parcubacteria bacterium C7867-003]|nr:MAG: trigger factor [Parcubacteria bacterium C7867-003]